MTEQTEQNGNVFSNVSDRYMIYYSFNYSFCATENIYNYKNL